MQIVIKRRTPKFVQFSKRCLAAMILLWFAGAIFGACVVAWQAASGSIAALGDLLLYISAPMTGGIVSYMIKSAWEKQPKGENV